MNKGAHSADVYDSPLDLSNANDPRTLAIRLIGNDKDVLELGPATGRVTRVLKEHGCDITAVERDRAMSRNLEPYCSRVVIGDIEQLSLHEVLGEQKFDVILAGDFLEHLANPLKLIQELRPCLSDQGYIVASIPNIAHGSVRLSLLRGKFEYREIGILDQTHLRFFALEGILRMFSDAGFAVVDVHRIQQDPFQEPYIEGPRLDTAEVPPDVKKLIEDDLDAATVQFVVKAIPIESSASYLQALSTLQAHLQQKERTLALTQRELKKTVGAKHEEITALKQQEQSLHAQVAQYAAATRQWERRFREQERITRALEARNEQLLAWLLKYKNLKEKLLPTGSLRDRVARKITGHPLSSAPDTSAQVKVARPLSNSKWASDLQVSSPVDPPPEWLQDPKQPPVVIAIANWNRVDLLRRCVESIFAKTHYERYRICVYEQGSTDGSREYLQSLGSKLDAILADSNVGFVDANNVIIRRYPKWDVVFLNNDTEVTEGWLERLVETAYRADNIGLVGPKLVYPEGKLQEAGSQVFQDGSARAYGKHENQWDPRFNQLREVDYCSAACLYAKRKVLDCVGGFDSRYSPAYYEDADLAFATRAAGLKVLYDPRSTVIHREYSTSGGTAFDRMEANRSKFLEKWADPLKRQQKNFWEAVSVADREKVLVISNIVPAQDRSSGGTRLLEFLLLLTRHYDVVFAYLEAFGVQEYIIPLERYGITVFYPGYAKAVNNYDLDLVAILQNNNFRFIFCELFAVAEQYLGIIRQYSPTTPLIVDTFDVHFLREAREAATTKNEAALRKAEDTKRRELTVYKQADLVLTVTADDKQALLREDAELKISVIPNIHAIPPVVTSREGRRDLLFVGGFSHTPNVDGVLYFCREILPLVLQHVPETRVFVVGNSPPPEIVALASINVIVTGYVPYLAPYLQSALISIAPLRFGSGMKGKIGEAMAWGLPVVTTSIGAEGMGLQDGVDALIADTPEQFAERIVQLNHDPDLWNSVARHARARVEREWSPDAINERLAKLLACLEQGQIEAAS